MNPRFFDKVRTEFQALLAIVGAFCAGTATALALAGWVGLPDTVDRQWEQIGQHSEEITALNRAQRADSLRLVRIECLVTAMATKGDPIQRCGL
jgi:hypothetical protein